MAAGDLFQDPQAQKKKPLPGQPGDLAQSPYATNDIAGGTTPPPPPPPSPIAPAPQADMRPPTPTTPQPATTPAPVAATPQAGTPIGVGDWAHLGVTPAQATPGMPVPGQPGKVLQHSNGAWQIVDAQPAAAVAPTATAASPAAPTGPTVPTTADDVTAGLANAGASASQGTPTSVAQSFQQALINKLNPGAIDANNPAIAGAVNANKLAEQRGTEFQQNALAEQAARQGTSMSGGNDALSRGIAADSAARQGQFVGGAVQHLQDQQDQDLMNALGLGNNVLQTNATRAQQGSQFSQSLAEQARQANQAAENQRLGITTQGNLGQGDLALRGRLGDQQGNLALLGLLQNNDQFGRQLNQQGAQFGAGLDQGGLLGLLGLLGG